MCGIAGIWDTTEDPEALSRIAEKMTAVLHLRGPDGKGLWIDPRGALALGHRRLSIQDLSEHGKQPMTSESGRYVTTYNGEIYNADELRRDLGRDIQSFRGHSDTEVALAAIEKFGLLDAARRFNGMFAFALWDRERQELSLVRDRLGIKPLFYAWAGSGLLFASQTSSFTQHPKFDTTLSHDAIASFLESSCVASPLSIYRDAHKVVPGAIVTFSQGNKAPTSSVYWNAEQMAISGQAHVDLQANPLEAIDELEDLLEDSVRRCLVSDVPVGAFLSGGIDSSCVVAMMRKSVGTKVKTFTIGTNESSHDESSHARAVANHLGTEHHELIATPQDALALVPQLAEIYDEPFADSSQLPTLLVSRLAREHVTVTLSGDGGDELFAGYNRHLWGKRVASMNRLIPAAVRKMAGAQLAKVRPHTLDWIYAHLVPQIGSLDIRFAGDKAVKLARAISCQTNEEMYAQLTGRIEESTKLLLTPPQLRREVSLPPLNDVAHQFMFQDMLGYLPNDILTKLDRASMAYSLESRVPLLDHRVVEFAWRQPLSNKLHGGQGKWMLREVLARHVPRSLFERPKSGFGIPIASWLRGPLRDWSEDLLSKEALSKTQLLSVPHVRKMWSEHVDGQRDHSQHLWNVLMLQDWLRHRQANS